MANKLTNFLPQGTNNYLTPLVSFNGLQTDLVTPGVVGTITNTAGVAPNTGSYAVNAQGTPNMTVAVSSGQLYVRATPSGGTAQVFRVTSDASENVTIASNSTGSTVYDFVYLQLDSTKLNSPAATGLDVATFTTSRSTTAYSATNTTTYGNSNGAQSNAVLLAVVTVVNSATSIANSAITDARARLSLSNVASAVYNPVKFSVYRAAAHTSSSSATVILFDTKTFDTGNNVDIVTNKGRFTAPIAGFYNFHAAAGNTAATATLMYIALYKNGASYRTGTIINPSNANNKNTVSATISLAAGDYVEAYFVGGVGSTMSVGAADCYFDGYLLSAT